MLSKSTGTFHNNRKSKELPKKYHDFEDLPQLDKAVLNKHQLKELIQDIQNITELCLFFLKKPLNKEDLVALWKEVYNQTQFGLDLLSDS